MAKRNKRGNQTELAAYRQRRALNKKRVASLSGTFVLMLIFLFVMMQIGRAALALADDSMAETIAVEFGSIDLPVVLSGVIIRDETVYTANAAGRLHFDYDDLVRVRTGTQVASVQDAAAVQQLNANLAEVEAELLRLQEARADISAFSQDARRMNRQIQNMLDNNRGALLSGGFTQVYALRENMERSIAIRNNMLLSENRGSLVEMTEERSFIEQRLGERISTVTVRQSGILSYLVDGFEDVLTFENMHEISPEQTRMTVDFSGITRRRDVVVDDPIFKIVTSNTWYIALYAPAEHITEWQRGDNRTIYIERNGRFLPLEIIVDTMRSTNEETFLLLRATRFVSDFLDMRTVNIRLSANRNEGLKIPSAAIVPATLLRVPHEFVYEQSDGSPFVLRQSAASTEVARVPITITHSDEAFHMIFLSADSTLRIGDVLVGYADAAQQIVLSEVENIMGVFRLTNGFADFIQIDLDDDSHLRTGYALLDPARVRGIRAGDHIITNTRAVTDGQRLE